MRQSERDAQLKSSARQKTKATEQRRKNSCSAEMANFAAFVGSFVRSNGGDEIRPDINNAPLPVALCQQRAAIQSHLLALLLEEGIWKHPRNLAEI